MSLLSLMLILMFGFHNDIDASADGVAVTDNTLWQSDIALKHGKINCGASQTQFPQKKVLWLQKN